MKLHRQDNWKVAHEFMKTLGVNVKGIEPAGMYKVDYKASRYYPFFLYSQSLKRFKLKLVYSVLPQIWPMLSLLQSTTCSPMSLNGTKSTQLQLCKSEYIVNLYMQLGQTHGLPSHWLVTISTWCYKLSGLKKITSIHVCTVMFKFLKNMVGGIHRSLV